MSQSPVDDFSENAISSYKQGWRALSRLLHEDRSFSGGERHCAFLNTAGGKAKFADVSALTGFGFPDDGRGLATVDWDFDGDLDLWITNRTAPRVRFLKNNSSSKQNFVAFRLEGNGTTSNRDAIGARLELTLEGARAATRIRSLRCGEGFLSQSSNWIHFGMGKNTAISRLVIRWPAGGTEEITALQANQFYLVRQGSGKATPVTPPKNRTTLAASRQAPHLPSAVSRTIAPPGLLMPQLQMIGKDGQSKPYLRTGKAPLLINIWSSICDTCITELTDWSSHAGKLKSAGLEVVTFNTDHLDGGASPADARSALEKSGSPFPNIMISEESLKALDFLQRSLLDRRTPLPVPSSFLAAPSGELIAFYRGPVSIAQVLRDLPLGDPDLSPEARRNASVPFKGIWVSNPVPARPNRVASLMADHDEVPLGASYLNHCAFLLESETLDSNGKRNLGDIYYVAGLLNGLEKTQRSVAIKQLTRARDLIPDDVRIRLELGRQHFLTGDLRNAEKEMTMAARINPDDLALLMDLGLMRFRIGEFQKSHDAYSKVAQATPRNGMVLYHLANNEVRLGRLPAAIGNYRNALTRVPNLSQAANNLAWILASHPDDGLRSPEEALEITTHLCRETRNKSPLYLDTHSIALANTGKFEEAIVAANKAIALIPAENTPAIEGIRRRLALYGTKKPYREAAWAK